jgi:SAM-dependent methyltransferase
MYLSQATASAPELCQDWNFQIDLPSSPLKRRAKVALGQALSFVLPRRLEQIKQGQRPLPYALIDRLIATALMDRLLREGRTDAILEMLKRIWRRPDALAYYTTTESWFTNRFLTEHIDFIEQLKTVAAGGHYQTLYEFGCGRGLVTNYLAEHLEGIQNFIGLDLNEHQIEMNRIRFNNPKLSFLGTDAVAWLNQQTQPGCILFSYGSLMYVLQADLEHLLNNMAKNLAPAAFAVMEIVGHDHDMDREFESRPFEAIHHLSHNYPALARRAGLTIRYRDERTTAGRRWIFLLATAE